jgi:aminopeptidase YwaD
MNRSLLGALLSALCCTLPACTGLDPELRSLVEQTAQQDGQNKHLGPPVEVADTGTARFVKTLYDGFKPHRALELVTFIDRFYRAPANRGFDEVLARVDKTLREVGFDGQDQRLQVSFIKVADVEDAWTPVSGKLVLKVEGEESRVLHQFSKSEDVDRVMLPINTPSCHIEAEVALRLDDVKKGMLLVTNVDAAQVKSRALNRGAVGVISASLRPFNEDTTGAKRHLEAIQFRKQDSADDMPAAQISPHSLEVIEAAVERAHKRGAKVKLEFQAEVLTEKRPLRTLMAVIKGAKRPGEAVAMVSHVQEPGANDNASGVAGLAESVRALVEALRENKLAWPDRSLVFLWGDEFRQSECWLNTTTMKPVAGISSDMTGQSFEATQAIALLERNYDPGAIKVLPPDFHTPWGAGQVSPEEIKPNGLALIARCALADVSMLEGGKWRTAEHPFEGGSDHDKFLQRGIPAVLFWHFTDFTYHTSLDRMQFVDADEMRRTGVALLATGLGIACAEPGDLDRYVQSMERERLMRIQACEDAEDIDLAEMWDSWSVGTREWLRNLCLGIDEKIPVPKK